MEAKIVGKNLNITIPLQKATPTKNGSGKNLVVVSSRGFQLIEKVKVNGKPLKLNVTGLIPAASK